jgi:transposase
MIFSDNDLLQMDDAFIDSLSLNESKVVFKKVLMDLKKAREKLNQNPTNSSVPPSTRKPWEKGVTIEDGLDTDDCDELDEVLEIDNTPEQKDNQNGTRKDKSKNNKVGKPGQREGAAGHGRKLELKVTEEKAHYPEECAICSKILIHQHFTAWTAYYVVDLDLNNSALLGLQLTHVKHIYYDGKCECGHVTRKEPGRCEDDEEWTVSLTEWRLVGPTMVSFIVCLSKNHRMSLAKISEFLKDWLGLSLCKATINQCLHEAGRAVSPLEEGILSDIIDSALIHADETSWHEGKTFLWLWIFSSQYSSLFYIKSREKEVANLILKDFKGWLMSDGYLAYRFYGKRLRCWAHLIRKAKGLEDSLTVEANNFGKYINKLFDDLIKAIYEARDNKVKNIEGEFLERLNKFEKYCYRRYDSPHEKTKALAREFLNDWASIWRVLSNVDLPITNNVAETSLRHWVINRKITYGTRTEQGSRVVALLASVIETCRKRNVPPWIYLASVMTERRKGNDAPPLPRCA